MRKNIIRSEHGPVPPPRVWELRKDRDGDIELVCSVGSHSQIVAEITDCGGLRLAGLDDTSAEAMGLDTYRDGNGGVFISTTEGDPL